MLNEIIIFDMNKLGFILVSIVLLSLFSCNKTYFSKTVHFSDVEKQEINVSQIHRLNIVNEGETVEGIEFSNYINLRYLNLTGTHSSNVEIVLSKLPQLKKLKVLILDSCDLYSVPKSIIQLKNVEHISLANNPNLDIERTINLLQKLPNLEKLNLASNQIGQLPVSFNLLENLKVLRLSGNFINKVEDFKILGSVKKLSVLWLDNNNITELPKTIGELKVEELYLDNNSITKLPKEIKSCKKMRVLYLGNNQFKTLPVEITSMRKLLFLVINENQITSIPAEFITEKYPLMAIILSKNNLPETEVLKAKRYFKGFFLLEL